MSNIQTSSSGAREADLDRSVMSPYIFQQDMLMAPLRPLVHLVGYKDTHGKIINIARDAVFNQTQVKGTVKLTTYLSFDFDEKADYQQQKLSKTPEIGLLRHSFFHGLSRTKPAVAVMVFNWEQEGSLSDWKNYEAQIMLEVKRYRDKNSPATKFILVIFLPLGDASNVEEKSNSLKRTAQSSEHADVIKTFFLLINGMDGLNQNSKKFAKVLIDLIQSHYVTEKNRVKRK